MRPLWLMIICIALVLAGYGLGLMFPGILNSGEALASLIFLSILLMLLLFGGERRRASWRAVMVNCAIWVAVLTGAVVAYDNRHSISQMALKTLSALQPGRPVMLSEDEAVITRERNGHFAAYATINDRRLHLLVDTGSTDIALPYTEARRLGIDVTTLDFSRPVLTANGRAHVAPITLEKVMIGGIILHDVSASVAEPGRLGNALLGMSFLGRLSEFSFQGDKLVLRQ